MAEAMKLQILFFQTNAINFCLLVVFANNVIFL